jgi:hypothetical protein
MSACQCIHMVVWSHLQLVSLTFFEVVGIRVHFPWHQAKVMHSRGRHCVRTASQSPESQQPCGAQVEQLVVTYSKALQCIDVTRDSYQRVGLSFCCYTEAPRPSLPHAGPGTPSMSRLCQSRRHKPYSCGPQIDAGCGIKSKGLPARSIYGMCLSVMPPPSSSMLTGHHSAPYPQIGCTGPTARKRWRCCRSRQFTDTRHPHRTIAQMATYQHTPTKKDRGRKKAREEE